jgi:hypothetical protein
VCGGVWRVSFRICVSVVFECVVFVCVGGLVGSFLVCVGFGLCFVLLVD